MEKTDLEMRIKEFEETLAKDKDERIQRLLDTQHTLEKEIDSLKAALDMRGQDLLKLRSKNNELTTKLEDYNELNMKMRRYKQELEQANAVLKNKQDTERRVSEHNRLLAMRIEVKDREIQRLSLANEEAHFRLKNTNSLSFANQTLNCTNEFNTADNTVDTDDSIVERLEHSMGKHSIESFGKTKLGRASTICTAVSGGEDLVDHYLNKPLNVSTPPSSNPAVKLRSKSFRPNLVGNKFNNSLTKLNSNEQFRPVSESFDFDLSDRNVYMTRSVIMYDENMHGSGSLVHESTTDNNTICTIGNYCAKILFFSNLESEMKFDFLNDP
jgi:hypothetical protein